MQCVVGCFYLAGLAQVKGRALGGKRSLSGKFCRLLKSDLSYQYETVINRKLVMGMADGEVEVMVVIYTATDLKVGLFQDTSVFTALFFISQHSYSIFPNSL